MDEATQALIEILSQINQLSGAALDALTQGQSGGEAAGAPPAPAEGEAPPPEGA